MPGLLADGVGTGSIYHRHGYSWRGTLIAYLKLHIYYSPSLPGLTFFFPPTPFGFSRRAAERKASGTGPDSAHDTTQWHTAALRSPHGSAQSLAATPPRGWRSNTSWRAKRGLSGTCSTQTGPTTAVLRTSKASSVSGITIRLSLSLPCSDLCFYKRRRFMSALVDTFILRPMKMLLGNFFSKDL